MSNKSKQGPKVLFADIETAPILASVWGLFDQNVALNQIKSDWHMISFAAKWQGDSKVIYRDQRNAKNVEDDSNLVRAIWKLLDEADIVIWQNGKRFDHKKLNARFILNGLKPPAPYKQIDTLEIAKKHFAFTSNKLEYLSDKLCNKYKKLTDANREYAGFHLWKSCLSGDIRAWKEMERYNRHDVLALEELYNKIAPWDRGINFNLYRDSLKHVCNCGSDRFECRGYKYTAAGKFQQFKCLDCGAWTRGKENLFNLEKRKSLRNSAIESS